MLQQEISENQQHVGTCKMATTMEDSFKFGLDIHFAQRLAGNFTKIRERTVKKLKRWITARCLKQEGEGMEDELMRLWKGLFYCMWMCDKPVVQEELADKIGDLVHSFTTPRGAMMFFDAFLLTMKREWVGIDRLRMDKYFMFVRRCFRQVLVVLRNNDWEESVVDQFLAVLCKTPLSTDPDASPDGLCYHFVDIYREELARCAGKELTPSDQVMKLIEPFCALVTTTRNKTLVKVILQGFFQEIVDESDVGFPVESEDEGIDSGEDDGGEAKENEDKENEDKKNEDKDEEEEEMEAEEVVKEKRKFVRKERPKLQYDYQAIADRLFTLASKESTPGPVRRKVYAMVKKFRDLSEGVFPDYNIGSLLDYQDDDDDSRSYGDRAPPKKKKSRRRGGKQVRERRLAHAALMAARDGEDDGDDVGEGDADATDKEGKILEKGKYQKKRRPRRKKKQRGSINEEAKTEEEGKTSSENKSNSALQEGHRIVQILETAEDKNLLKETAAENEVSQEKSSPGFDESDGRVKEKKKAKKRKSEDDQIGIAMAVSNGDNMKTKKSETTAIENRKMVVKDTETEDVANVEATGAGSESEFRGKCKGGAKKRKSTERPQSPGDVGDSANVADLKETRKPEKLETRKPEKLETSKPEKLETGSSQNTKEEPGLPPSANGSKQSNGSPTATDTSGQLNEGSKPQTPSKGGKQKTQRPFAAFQAVSTPPAFVRRRPIRKVGEPQSEPPRKKESRLFAVLDDTDSDQTTPRKRVKIALGLNEAHASKDYKKQLVSSPGIPFDGSKKPIQSALKTPSPKPRPPIGRKTATPKFRTPSPKVLKKSQVKSSSKKTKTPKTASNLRRSSRIEKQDF